VETERLNAAQKLVIYCRKLEELIIIIIIIRNLYSAIMPIGGYRGADRTGR